MSKPAARIGDTTSHGGAIVAGAPTVLIGGKPAARANDMHTCPMMNPGVPPPPHVGGPVLLGSPTVLICGQMAARMGDMSQCSGPPDSIVMGCPTVLIGEGAGGGGAGAGPAGAAASAAMAGDNPQSDEDHYLDVKFVDKKGKPIRGVNYKIKTPDGKKIKGTLSGQLKKTGVKQGNHEIQLIGIASASWSVTEAKVGDKVKLTAETFGIDSGTSAMFSIFKKDISAADEFITWIEAKIENDKAEVEWEFPLDGEEEEPEDVEAEEKEKYSKPEYYFTITADGVMGRSPTLYFKDYVEILLEEEDNKGVAGQEYRLVLSNGEVRTGKLDSNGYAKEENIPPVKSKIEFPGAAEILWMDSGSESQSEADDEDSDSE